MTKVLAPKIPEKFSERTTSDRTTNRRVSGQKLATTALDIPKPFAKLELSQSCPTLFSLFLSVA
jgi:hypothetical protein